MENLDFYIKNFTKFIPINYNSILINLNSFISSKEFSIDMLNFLVYYPKIRENYNINNNYVLYNLEFSNNTNRLTFSFLYPYINKDNSFEEVYDTFYLSHKNSFIILHIKDY
jgi:hypothetical protein